MWWYFPLVVVGSSTPTIALDNGETTRICACNSLIGGKAHKRLDSKRDLD